MNDYKYLYCPHLTEPPYDGHEEQIKVELDVDTTLCLCKFCANQVKLSVLLRMFPIPQTQYVPIPYPANPPISYGRQW